MKSTVQIIQWHPTSEGFRLYGPISILQPEHAADFEAHGPDGFTMGERAYVTDANGRLHIADPQGAAEGYDPSGWTLAAQEAEEELEELILSKLDAAEVERIRPGYKPVAERRAKRVQDRAEAEARTVAKKAEEAARAAAEAQAAQDRFDTAVDAAAARLVAKQVEAAKTEAAAKGKL